MREVFDLAAKSVVAVTVCLKDAAKWEERAKSFFENLASVMTPVSPERAEERIRGAQAWIARQVGKWESEWRKKKGRKPFSGIPPAAGAVVSYSLSTILKSSEDPVELAEKVSTYVTLCKWLVELATLRVYKLPVGYVRGVGDVERVTFDELIEGMLK